MDHIVFLPYPMWGHAKPAYPIAARIVRAKPTYITLLTAKDYLKRVLAQAADPRFSLPEDRRKLIRVVCLDIDASQGFSVLANTAQVFPPVYKTLFEGQPVKCAATGTIYEAVPSPVALIVDYFGYPCFQAARSISAEKVPIFAWNSSTSGRLLHDFAPESEGGVGDIYEKAKGIAAAQNREDVFAIAKQLYYDKKGEVQKVPGLPEMYDYEFLPQVMPVPDGAAMLLSHCCKFLADCDGIIQGTSEVFEPEAIQAAKAWFAKKSRQIFTFPCVGFPGPRPDEKNAEFDGFLDNILSKHGKHSLVYVCFGTTWWSSEPEKVWAFVDVLMELKTPFILSYPAHAAKLPEDLPTRVKASGIGLLSSWSPQELVLNHPATGWFVSHCGQNSTMESLEAGVPMMCWPFGGDQPGNAAILSEKLGVAYELLQIRTGEHGLRPLRRFGPDAKPISGTVEAAKEEAREVVKKAFGADGADKRQKAQIVKQKLFDSWKEPDGESVLDVKRFVAFIGSNH